MPEAAPKSQLFNQIKQSIQSMDEDSLLKVQGFMTPEFSDVMGLLFGQELTKELAPLVDSSRQLVPVPTQAMKFLGEEKFNNFITKALEKAQESAQQSKQTFVQSQNRNTAPAQSQSTAPTGLLPQKPRIPIPQSSRSDQTSVPPIA